MSPSLSSNIMRGNGRAAPPTRFNSAEVLNVQPGETEPEIVLWNGNGPSRELIGRVFATQGARIDQSVHCHEGIFLEVLGSPHAIEVEVWFNVSSLLRAVLTDKGWICPP